MRRALLASLLLAGAVSARAQDAIHEYRPEIVLTLPRVDGYGIQILAEQHLSTSNLAASELIQGVGLSTPILYGPAAARFVMELRQVITPTATEHRYIPTVTSAIPLGAGFEMRSRTRVEIRDINRTWSERWQDRSAVGHDIDIGSLPLWTYGQLDMSYDSRYATINRIEKQAGTRVPVAHGTSVDVFVMRQDDSRRTPRTLYGYGAVLRITM